MVIDVRIRSHDPRADRVAVRADGTARREVHLELGSPVRAKIERLRPR